MCGKQDRFWGEVQFSSNNEAPNTFLNCEFVRSWCVQAFSAKEKLQKHLLCHGEQEAKPLACSYCNRRFMNNSALACHLKIHSEKKYYQCPLCHEGEAASVCREGVVNVV